MTKIVLLLDLNEMAKLVLLIVHNMSKLMMKILNNNLMCGIEDYSVTNGESLLVQNLIVLLVIFKILHLVHI